MNYEKMWIEMKISLKNKLGSEEFVSVKNGTLDILIEMIEMESDEFLRSYEEEKQRESIRN